MPASELLALPVKQKAISKNARDEDGPEKPRVLLVEDSASLRKILKLSFTLKGFDVETAEMGEEALERVESFQPEAIVIDLGLPDMSGYDLLQRVREHAAGNEPTIYIALSGRSEPKDIQKSKEAGFDAHFVKPPDFDELIEFIREKTASAR